MTAVISMWSGPRNISTTMMRSFGARSDTAVLDEPFYSPYLARTGADHPHREETLAAGPRSFESVIDLIERRQEKPALFLKNIAYHLPDDVDFGFLAGWRNFLLIRDPRAMVASFADRLDDVTPIVKSYDVGMRILDYLTRAGLPCPIIDAEDVLRAPPALLRALCASLGMLFEPEMLVWSPGPRPEDGPWAPHWYQSVFNSSGFKPYVEKKIILSSVLEETAARAMPAYRVLWERRLAA